MFTRFTLLWREFLSWFLRPRIIALVVFAIIMMAITFWFLSTPVVFLALKKFVSNTLPKLGARLLKSVSSRWMKRIAIFLGSTLMLSQLKAPIEICVGYIGSKKENAFNWWGRQPLKLKVLYVGVVILVGAIPLGGWIIYLIPVVVLKDVGLFVAKRLGLSALLAKVQLGDRAWNMLPEKFRHRQLILIKWKIMRSLVKKRKKIEGRVDTAIEKRKEKRTKKEATKHNNKTQQHEAP